MVSIREWFSVPLRDPTNIRMRPEPDGGALAGIGCYCVSMARLIAGEPVSVYGEQVIGETGVDVRFHGLMRFPADVIAQFDTGLALPTRHGVEIVGRTGTIVVRDPWFCREPSIEITTSEGRTRTEIDVASSYQLQVRNFSRAVQGVAIPLLGRDDALGQARAIEGLYASADQGAVVKL